MFESNKLHLFKDDGFADVLYNTQWYNLPLKYQLDIMHMINRKQNGVTINIGPFGSIDRELFKIVGHHQFITEKHSHTFHSIAICLFLQITNKVYSFVMFLRNFAA